MVDYNVRVRDSIKKGMNVAIAINPNDDETRWVNGSVESVMTTKSYDEDGIKVRIDDGTIGFTKKISESDEISSSQILKMIQDGETKTVEFKETFKVDISSQKELKCLRDATVKEIAAFMNTEGGFLLIGVDDSKKIAGISRDYEFVSTERATQTKSDKLKQEIRDYVKQKLADKTLESQYNIMIKNISEKEICVIHVNPSVKPVFVNQKVSYQKYGSNKQLPIEHAIFYIRHDSGTEELNARSVFEFWHNKQKQNI